MQARIVGALCAKHDYMQDRWPLLNATATDMQLPLNMQLHLYVNTRPKVQQVNGLLLHHSIALILQDDARRVVAEQELFQFDLRHVFRLIVF